MPFEEANVRGKNVLIIEDVYDTGNSMEAMRKVLLRMEPKTLKVAVAFHKMNSRNLEFNYWPDYCGFFVSNEFVIGYGLDYNQQFRHLPHLCVIS